MTPNSTYHSSASSNRSLSSFQEVVFGYFAHIGHLHVSMRIYSSWDHESVTCIYNFGIRERTDKWRNFPEKQAALSDSKDGTYTIMPFLTSTSALNIPSSFTTVPFLTSSGGDIREVGKYELRNEKLIWTMRKTEDVYHDKGDKTSTVYLYRGRIDYRAMTRKPVKKTSSVTEQNQTIKRNEHN